MVKKKKKNRPRKITSKNYILHSGDIESLK